MRSQTDGRGRAGEPALFSDAADEIRRLLHQFAAGFLRAVEPGLMERLADHERWPSLPPQPVAEFAPAPELQPSQHAGAGHAAPAGGRRRGHRRGRCHRRRAVPDLRGRGRRAAAAAAGAPARLDATAPATPTPRRPACARCTPSRAVRAWPARCAWARWRTGWRPAIEAAVARNEVARAPTSNRCWAAPTPWLGASSSCASRQPRQRRAADAGTAGRGRARRLPPRPSTPPMPRPTSSRRSAIDHAAHAGGGRAAGRGAARDRADRRHRLEPLRTDPTASSRAAAAERAAPAGVGCRARARAACSTAWSTRPARSASRAPASIPTCSCCRGR